MSCNLDLKDIANEMKKGTISPTFGLSVSQMAGVLTAVVVTVDQPADAITDKGLGTYGLSVRDLQLTGIVKCGVDPTQVIDDILADPSVFTGKHGVNSVDDLLPAAADRPCSAATALAESQRKEALQQQLMNDVITSNMNDLASLGAVTCSETVDELAALAGQAAKFTPTAIIAKLNGEVTDLLSSAMDALGALAVAGALIAAIKNADILGKLSGFGAATASGPELATNTVDTADTDAGVDSIAGSSRIPSESDSTSSAASTASSLLAAAAAAAVVTAVGSVDTTSLISPTEYIAQCQIL